MQFDAAQFNDFLKQLTATREQVDSIIKSAVTADEISEVSMILMFQSLFDVLMTIKEPKERLEFASTLKELFSSLNARRAVELKSKPADDKPAEKKSLDGESLKEIETKLKLM